VGCTKTNEFKVFDKKSHEPHYSEVFMDSMALTAYPKGLSSKADRVTNIDFSFSHPFALQILRRHPA
jgi:hypothetical protein